MSDPLSDALASVETARRNSARTPAQHAVLDAYREQCLLYAAAGGTLLGAVPAAVAALARRWEEER